MSMTPRNGRPRAGAVSATVAAALDALLAQAARGRNKLMAALCEMGESAEWRGRDVLDELADLGEELGWP